MTTNNDEPQLDPYGALIKPASEPQVFEGTLSRTERAASDISPKVSGGALAGAVTLVLVFIANRLGLDIPVEVEGGVVVLLTALAGYLIPDRS